MENSSRNFYVAIAQGVLRGFFMTLIILLIYSVAVHFVQVDESITSLLIIVATLLSVVYGSIYASKKSGKKGWLNGLLVAVIYFTMFYIIALIAQSREAALSFKDFARLLICMFVGMLSGMLGINI